MKILFLDDDPTRHAKFKMAHIGKDVTYVCTAEEAIEALDTEKFEEVSLDHDLGGSTSELTLPEFGHGSGYDVACHITNMPSDKLPTVVIIHSFNPIGAIRMALALSKLAEEGMRVLKIPFSY